MPESHPPTPRPATPLDVTDAVVKPAAVVRPGRVAFWALALGLGGFAIWAAFAPLDEGVPGQGTVAIDTKSKPVQHLAGGIVKQVFVTEGQQVSEGQVLIRLDDAVAKANFEAARQRYLGLRAMEGRLTAEQGTAAAIAWHPDLTAAMTDPQIRQMALTQEQLLASRRASLRADQRAIKESIAGQEGQLKAYAAMLDNRRQQLALLQDELGHTREMVSEGYVPRNRQLELERNVAELRALIAELLGNTTRTQRAIGEQRERATVRQQEYRKEVQTLSADVGREVQADGDKMRAVKDELARIEIRAPARGQVVGLSSQTIGAVVAPGQKLMDIVPGLPALLLEARVAPHLIDRVHAELPVDVRFASFSNSPQLVVSGRVVSVSADLLTDARTGAGYYLARVAVTPEGLKALGKRQMQPGMPVEVIFITGERSMLTYLLHPFTRRLAAAMKEQ